MLSSVDGRIDGAALRGVIDGKEYETTGTTLGGDAWICGRTTMQQHFAEKEPFIPSSDRLAGPQPVHVARLAGSYAISVDTLGRLRWKDGDLAGDHLICVVSERAPGEYLAMLREKGISYIVAGTGAMDLVRAVDLLGEHFGIRILLLEGGGQINGAFLDAGLVDELSLLIGPGVDGRSGVPAVFEGMKTAKTSAVALRLKSMEQRPGGTVWLRYEVVQPPSRNQPET